MAMQHDKQFKLDAIRYYQDHKDLGVRGCAENLGIGYSTLTKWLKDAILQIILTLILCLSLPLWKGRSKNEESVSSEKTLSLKEVLAIPGAKQIMLMFFCYCALEQTTGLWASSYLVLESQGTFSLLSKYNPDKIGRAHV